MAFTRFNLRFFVVFFCPGKKVYSLSGGTSSYLEWAQPRNVQLWHWACYFFRHNPRSRCTILVKRALAVIWRGTAQNAPPVAPSMHRWLSNCSTHSKLGRHGRDTAVGLGDIISKYSWHSRKGRHSLAWDNKTLTLLCLSEKLVFHFVCIAFTIK